MLTVHPHNLTPQQAVTAKDAHGLGLIHDATEARLLRRVNGDRSLYLTVPWTEKNANLLIADRLICYAGQFYRIGIPSRRDRAGRKTLNVEAAHVMYDLEHMPVTNIETAEDPETIDGIDAGEALSQLLSGSPFSAGTVDMDEEKLEYLDLLETPRTRGLEQIIERWGGEIVPDNWTISLLEQSGSDRGLQIRVGKNIDGIEMTEDITQVVTRLHVRGYQGASFEEINEGKDYIDSPMIGRYAFVREGYASFEDDEDAAELMRLGLEELDKRDKPLLSIRIDLLKLRGSREYAHYADLERLDEGDTVTVHHEMLGQNVKLRAMEVETDCLTGDTTSCVLDSINTEGLFHGFSSFVRTRELVRKILDHDGHVRARTLRGEIDLLTTRLIASGSYLQAEVIEGRGALFENTNASSPDYGAVYIGPGILAIADSKNPDNTWEWRTFGTGKGFVGSEILARSISGEKIMAHTIGVTEIVPEVITEVINTATGHQLSLECSHGTILDEDSAATTVSLRVWHLGQEITEQIPDSCVRWERVSDDPEGDEDWNEDPDHIGTKVITVTSADVDWRGVLRCIIEDDETAEIPIATGIIEITLQNLKTSFMSMTRRGIAMYGNSFLRLATGAAMSLEAGASFNLRAGTGSGAIGISNDDPDGYFMWAGDGDPDSAPFAVKRDGTMRNGANIYVMSFATEAGPDNPMTIPLFFPVDLYAIDKVLLYVRRKAFRATATGAASGGGSEETSRSGGGSTETSGPSGSGTTGAKADFDTNDSNAFTSGTASPGTSENGSHSHVITNHRHQVTLIPGSSNTVYTTYVQPGSVADGSHTHTVNSHYHSIGAHKHLVPAHYHSLNDHSHSVSIPSHKHIVDIPDHTHDLVYGIYEQAASGTFSVSIDGTVRRTGRSDETALDLADWFNKSGGKITRDTEHSVVLTPSGLLRFEVQIMVKGAIVTNTIGAL